jgi:mRNA-degrading endonuclease toxin of MazEF toxin-antitoxin module
MIQLGTALKSTEEPYHRCVVLSDPQANGGQVVLVRIIQSARTAKGMPPLARRWLADETKIS